MRGLTTEQTINEAREIIVTDSKAVETTKTFIAKEFPRVIYKPFAKNVGYAKLVNAGIQSAAAPYLLILNADVEIKQAGIKSMLAFLKETPNAAAVGVTDCFRFPTLRSLIARRTFLGKTRWGRGILFHYEMGDYAKAKPQAVDWVRGDCWMLKKSALKDIGLLDERFFMYFEDTDWCRRAGTKGYRIYFLPGIPTVQKKSGASRQQTVKGFIYRFIHFISFIRYRFSWNR